MLPYLLNTFTNVFCRTVLGDKASKLKQVPRFLKVDHHHTRQEEDQSMKKSCLVSWAFFLSSLRCVHGCMGMDVWVDVLGAGRKGLLWRLLERPLLPGNCFVFLEHIYKSTNIFCQYRPRRENLGRGPVLKSICQAFWRSTTTTLDRKRTTNRRRHVWWVECFARTYICSICSKLLQMFSVRTVLGDKASELEQAPSFLKVDHHHTGQEEDQ